jgi:hypothetical protein
MRSDGTIPKDISYFINEYHNYIFIYTDEGRFIRPVI